MAWVAPVIAAGSAVYNAVSANKRNKQQVELADTAIQRRMRDLKAAGINPALAYTQLGGAQTPNLETVQFDPGVSTSVANAYQQSTVRLQKELLQAQTAQATEQARANAEQAALTKAQRLEIIPANANQLAMQAQQFEAQAQDIAQSVKLKMQQLDIGAQDLITKTLTNEQLTKLQPLLLKYQEYLNRAEKAGLSEKEATALFYEALGPADKAVGLGAKLQELLKSGARNLKMLTK